MVASSLSIVFSSVAVAHHISWSSKPAAHSTFRQWPQSQRPSSSCSSSISAISFQTLRLASTSQSVTSSSTLGQSTIFILRGLLHHLPERALAVLKNLAAQWLRIGVELIGAETVRGICASTWPFLGRARVGFSIRTPHANFGITERSGDPGRIRCETRPFPIWRPVCAVIADCVRACEFPRAFPFP